MDNQSVVQQASCNRRRGKMMKAFCVTEPGKSKIIEIDLPSPNDGDVLLKVLRVGFCGTDLSTFKGKNPFVSYPRIPGHEIAAEIVEAGSAAPDYIVAGKPVTVIPYTNCGSCTSCLRGAANACRYNQTLGVQREGAMAEYITVPYEKVILTDSLDIDRLVLVEPLTVGFHAVSRGEITDSDTVLIIGCGMIGMGAIIRSVLRGATVVVSDIDDSKLETARRFGASFTLNPARDKVQEFLRDITSGNGVDVVIEAVGSPATYRIAVEEVAFAGRIVCIGYSVEDATFTFLRRLIRVGVYYHQRQVLCLGYVSLS